MWRWLIGALVVCVAAGLVAVFLLYDIARRLPIEVLEVPPGFSVTLVTDEVPNARQMIRAESGTLFVGSRTAGNVYAVIDRDGDFKPESIVTIAEGLRMPSGLALGGTDLYVAATDRILRLPDAEQRVLSGAPLEFEVVADELPDDRMHGWKYLAFGPDGRLYFGVGAPCNVCVSEDPVYASIMALDTTTAELEVYASGIRNTVGHAWHPTTGHLWFSENGRDLLGDDVPPDEINRAITAGQHFGFPYLHGSSIADPEYGEQEGQLDVTPPVWEVQAHSAVVGLDFYHSAAVDSPYRNALLVAEHGSWNRSSKVGYRVSALLFQAGEPEAPAEYAPFVTGWLQGEKDWGRPADVLVLDDGSVLISDDKAGAVYRVFPSAPTDRTQNEQ